ncbi:MAG: hypothetical protein QF680_00650 [Acidobacteriota bacterium]|nr:hypothetical protein [Acidobacteriota bacterium]
MSHSCTTIRSLIVGFLAVAGLIVGSTADGGVVESPRQYAEEHYNAAEAMLADGDAEEALQLFAAIVDNFPRTQYPLLSWRAAANLRAGQIEIDLGRVDAGAARFVDVIDGEPPSVWTTRARLGLAKTLLWNREWQAAARLLQTIVDVSGTSGPESDIIAYRAAEDRLTLLHRLWLRAEAGERPWQQAGRYPVDFTFDRPIGIAAGINGVLVTDEGNDSAVFFDSVGTAASFRVADPQRPWWGTSANGFIAAGSMVSAPLRTKSFQFVYSESSRQRPLDDIRAGAGMPDGGWYLVDSEYRGVMRFERDGTYDRILDTGANSEPVDLDRGPRGRLFVIEERRREVLIFDADGVLSAGFAYHDWREPYALAVDSIGYVYVLDRSLKRIDVFDQDGGFLWNLGPVLPGGIELDDPRDLTVDSTGRILIADRGLRTVLVVE